MKKKLLMVLLPVLLMVAGAIAVWADGQAAPQPGCAKCAQTVKPAPCPNTPDCPDCPKAAQTGNVVPCDNCPNAAKMQPGCAKCAKMQPAGQPKPTGEPCCNKGQVQQ